MSDFDPARFSLLRQEHSPDIEYMHSLVRDSQQKYLAARESLLRALGGPAEFGGLVEGVREEMSSDNGQFLRSVFVGRSNEDLAAVTVSIRPDYSAIDIKSEILINLETKG